MQILFSLILTIAAAVLAHAAVRYAQARKRAVLAGLALVALAAGMYYGDVLGGFWPGVYTLLSVFFLTTVITPWVDYLVRQRFAK